MVEAQHQVATRKLVDSAAEHEVLEDLLERHKPRAVAAIGLHYLLSTPFRYPPLRHGSRFATRRERGLWYGSEVLSTAFAEVAYYRLLFLEGTKADLGRLEIDLTAFVARVKTARGVDLTVPPFAVWRARLASRSSYAATQPLGSAMRAAEVEAFRYVSARDPEGGINVGVFSPRAFATRRPRRLQTWRCLATRDMVELSRRDYFSRADFRFARRSFLVHGELPAPAV